MKMQKWTKKMILACLTLGIFLAGLPILVNYAQNKSATSGLPDENNRLDQERQAREAVAKSVPASLFLDKISVKENTWKLKKGTYLAKIGHGDPSYVSTIFENGKQKVFVDFSEFFSAAEAIDAYNIPRSHGSGIQAKQFGGDGEKVYGRSGAFAMLRFRVGNINVTVSGTDEITAEIFARHASDTIRSFLSK